MYNNYKLINKNIIEKLKLVHIFDFRAQHGNFCRYFVQIIFRKINKN